jgi:hypothetical protein
MSRDTNKQPWGALITQRSDTIGLLPTEFRFLRPESWTSAYNTSINGNRCPEPTPWTQIPFGV